MRRLLWASALCALGLVGCKGEGAKGTPGNTASSKAAVAAGGAAVGGAAASAASVTTPLAHATVAALPDDVRLVIAARAPAKLLDLLDYAGLRVRMSRLHREITQDMIREIGHDLTDPSVLSGTYGLDLDQPVGFYVTRFNDFRFGVFAHLSDAKRAQAAISALFAKTPKPLQAEQRDGATVWIDPRGEAALVIKGDVLHIIGQARRNPYLLQSDVARVLATAKSTLGAKDDFKQAIGDLRVGRDAAMYVNVNQVIASIVAEVTGSARVQRLRDEVAAMEQVGGDPEVLQSKRQRLQRQEGRALERMAEGAVVSMAINTFAGGLSALAAGGQLDASSVELELGLRTLETALPQRLLNPGKGPLRALSALEKPPIYAGSMHFDLPGILGLVRQAATLSGGGQQLQRELDEFRREVGIDLETEIIPALTGGVELAVTVSIDPKNLPKRASEMERNTGGALLVEVSDPAKAKALLTRLFTHPDLRSIVTPAGEGWTVNLEREWRTVHVQMVGDRVVASTDAGFAERLSGKSCIAQMKPAAVAARAGAVDACGAHYFEWPRLAALSEGFDHQRRLRWATESEPSHHAVAAIKAPPEGTAPNEAEKALEAEKARRIAKAVEAIDAEKKAADLAWREADHAAKQAAIAQFAALGGEVRLGGGKRLSVRLSQGLATTPAKALSEVLFQLEHADELRRQRWRTTESFDARRTAVTEGRPDPGP